MKKILLGVSLLAAICSCSKPDPMVHLAENDASQGLASRETLLNFEDSVKAYAVKEFLAFMLST